MQRNLKPWWVLITLVLILVTKLAIGQVNPGAMDTSLTPGNIILGEQVSLVLPDRYRGGNPMRDLVTLKQDLAPSLTAHPDFANYLEQNAEIMALLAIDTQGDGAYPTGVNIISEELPEGQTFGDYVALNRDRLTAVYQLVEEQESRIHNYPSHKLLLSKKLEEVNLNQLIYLISTSGDQAWTITFSTAIVRENAGAMDEGIGMMEEAINTITFGES